MQVSLRGRGWVGVDLHIEKFGVGAPLLLIHGWGMHGGMWQPVVKQLAEKYAVHVVDLPGHGLSRDSDIAGENGQAALDNIVTQLADRFDAPLGVMGWSLGGQVALRWATKHPEQITRLLLVASTPCFVQKEGWFSAMAEETLKEFAEALLQNPAQTLKRFLALQVRGSENERELLTILRAELGARGEARLSALESGLHILRDADLREQLQLIRQPVQLIAGARDMLTPAAASQYMAEQLSDARLAIIEGAAHAPFLSHTQQFMQYAMEFLNERI